MRHSTAHRAPRNLRRAYLRHEGDEHAAHLGWLAGLRGLGGRLRHLGSTALRLAESAPRLGEGVAASVLAGVVIAGGGGILPSSAPEDGPITPRGAAPTLVVPAEEASAVPRPGGAPPSAMTVRPPPAASHIPRG
ncbi:MAG TPA: hypothetical protein VMM13_13980 [Euzebya sp.]|nr:hypothetical protein [Euzebya sp.]